MRSVTGSVFLFLVVLVLSGCLAPLEGPSDAINVVISADAYDHTATFDFGNVGVDEEPRTVAGNVANISLVDLGVTSVIIAEPDSAFSFSAPETPFTLAAGESDLFSLTFDPEEAGAASATLLVTIDGIEQPFTLNLVGTGIGSASDYLAVRVGADTYASGTTYDFGVVDPETTAESIDLALENISDVAVTVSGIGANTTDFTLALADSPPFDLAPGASVDGTLTFDIDSSGQFQGEFSFVMAGADEDFTFNASGEGNFRPVARVRVDVSGAAVAAANGAYYKTDETQNTYPVYRPLAVSDYRIYGADLDGIAWLIDNDFDISDWFNDPATYSIFANQVFTAPNGTWFSGSQDTATSVGEIKSDGSSVQSLSVGDVISPNYEYFDLESDVEGLTTYQWYRSDTTDALGTYTPVDGATSSEYTITTADYSSYLKVLVTPLAESGTTTGDSVWFGPSPRVVDPPQQLRR